MNNRVYVIMAYSFESGDHTLLSIHSTKEGAKERITELHEFDAKLDEVGRYSYSIITKEVW